jgi:hypothetical protein
VGQREDLQQPIVMWAGQQRRHIAGERRLDHRIGRRLERNGGLRPQRPVVVEHRDPLGQRHEVGGTVTGDTLHVVDHGLLRRRVIPRRKRIGGGSGR